MWLALTFPVGLNHRTWRRGRWVLMLRKMVYFPNGVPSLRAFPRNSRHIPERDRFGAIFLVVRLREDELSKYHRLCDVG